jgi:hypothetical protein
MKRKKIRFRMSEWLFLTFGMFLMLSSLFLLKNDYSLVMLFNLHLSPGDPFEASYYTAPAPTALPAPVASAASTPTPVLAESSKVSVYLLSPANQSVVQKSKKSGRPTSLTFKFEVEPKASAATFELLFRNQVVKSFAEAGNASGIHEISLPFSKPGLYQWRVKAIDITSELRTVIIHE